MDLTALTIAQAHQGLVKKEFSALELTKAFLDKIKREDEKIFSFLTVTENSALSQAKEVDDLILQGGEIPLLAGIPLAIKDNILIEGVRCTAGSKILENYIASFDATCVKLLRAQKAVFLGKTNLDEFAMGSSCENSAFFKTRNPCDLDRVPGGSSGGSAAAVAANFCCGALGSDTGGSIRLPASFCGVTGLKPTYGAVSRFGLIAMASSLDQIGPIAKNVEDAKILFRVIAKKDRMDSTSMDLELARFRGRANSLAGGQGLKGVKIGVPKEYFIEGIDEEVERAIKAAIKKYEELGAEVFEVSLPHTEYALAVYYIIMPSEVSANLARYDGIKYGMSNVKCQMSNVKCLLDVYLQTREQGFGEEVRRRIMLGTYALSSGYYEAYYLRAQKVRTLIKEDFKNVFQKADFLLTPTSPAVAFRLGEKTADPLKMYLSDILTIAVNLAGLPAISVPCPTTNNNLPIGLQLIGKPFEEDRILELGEIFEKSYD